MNQVQRIKYRVECWTIIELVRFIVSPTPFPPQRRKKYNMLLSRIKKPVFQFSLVSSKAWQQRGNKRGSLTISRYGSSPMFFNKKCKFTWHTKRVQISVFIVNNQCQINGAWLRMRMYQLRIDEVGERIRKTYTDAQLVKSNRRRCWFT